VYHYLVESYAGYKAVKGATEESEICWHTTSPYLLKRLPKEGEKVHSPEVEINREEMDKLAKAAYDISDICFGWFNDICCSWRNYADLRLIFSAAFRQCFFTTFYKGLVLQNLLERVKKVEFDRLTGVGSVERWSLDGTNLNYGRLDTLYAYLASMSDRKDIGTFLHQIPSEKIKEIQRAVTHRKMSTQEKILSLLNNTPSSFLYKTIKRLKSKRWFPFQHVGVRPWAKKNFYIYKDCELLEEAFWGLLWRGGRIGWLERLPETPCQTLSYENLPDAPSMGEKISDTVTETLRKEGIKFQPIYKTALNMVTQRTLTVLERLRKNLKFLSEGFDNLISSIEPRSTILTNSLTTPLERLFYCYCTKVGVKVAAFEHGITMGLSEESKWHARQVGMIAADIGFYHNREAVDAVTPYSPDQEKIVAGVPRVTGRVLLPALQRFLVRRWLGIGNRRHVVMYLASLERNNSVYGPYNENDLHFLESTKNIFHGILKGFPRSLCLLKLYPSQRYLECYDFSGMFNEYDNALLLRDVDFRFIRAAADLIFVTSPQSTLGWVIGSGKPTIFAELKFRPVTFDAFEMGVNSMKEIGRLLFISPNHTLMEKRNLKSVFQRLFQND